MVWVILGAAGCGCPGACSTVSSYDLQLLQSPLQNWVSGDQAVTSRHRWSAALHLGPSCQLGSASVLSLFINTPPAPLFTAHYLSVFMFYEWQRRDTAVIMQQHAVTCSNMQHETTSCVNTADITRLPGPPEPTITTFTEFNSGNSPCGDYGCRTEGCRIMMSSDVECD